VADESEEVKIEGSAFVSRNSTSGLGVHIICAMFSRIVLAGVLLIAATARSESATVSAAISLKDAISEIGATLKQQTGVDVQFQFGASGKLAEQIKQGAPVDLFISAAWKQVKDLAADGSVDEKTARVIARNTLVLIVPANAANPPAGFKELADARFKRIAIGEPRTVPAGDYAMQVLESLKIADVVGKRLVFGANVRQVLDYVERGEVDAGIVYRTDALESGEKVKLIATADAKLHQPIEYPAVVVKSAANRTSAERFVDFLSRPEAAKIFEAHGFSSAQP
jgi:molybdate transport system substrate-binding protein